MGLFFSVTLEDWWFRLLKWWRDRKRRK